jgi:hypothetical protein
LIEEVLELMNTLAKLACFVFVTAAGLAPAIAGVGTAELTLDRNAVAGLVEAALPAPHELTVPGLGTVSIEVLAPKELRFVDGGVEAVFPLRIAEIDWSTEIDVRYEPDVEPLLGTVRLLPVSAVPDLPLPLRFDLAPWLGAVDLPRRLDWQLELREGRTLDVICFVQTLRVGEERLHIELGLKSRSR